MKVAFIVNGFPTLSESFIISQITGLLDLGYDVQIFANYNLKEPEVHLDVKKYNLMERTYYIARIPRNKTARRLKTLCLITLNFPKGPTRILKALKILLGCKEGFSYYLLYWVIPFLWRKFDVIHCHFGPAGNVGSFLQDVGFNGKLVTTFHGYDVTSYIEKHGPDVYHDLFNRADVLTYNSEATKTKILSLGCPPERMVKLPMGVNLDRITFAEKKIRSGERVNVLSVGRLVEMKGREYAIRGMAQVLRKFPNVSYRIAGDGPLRESLQKLINDLQVSDAIRLLGWVSGEKLDSLYESSHIFLHPSVKSSDGDIEGQGVVLLEAQAYGLSVVATNHGAFPESVLDGKSGFLVPERDVNALAEKLEYLIGHPERWPEMGRCGRDFVEKNYNIKQLSRQLADLYQGLVSAKAAKKNPYG